MQIYQQRAERVNLERLVSRVGFSTPLDRSEHLEILKLWRTAERTPANSVLDCAGSIQLITSGWAGWMRQTPRNKPLIFLFLMPGDFIIPGLADAGCCELISLNPMRCVDATPLLNNGSALTPRTGSMIADSGRYYRLLLIDHMTRLAIGCTTQAVAHLLNEFYLRSQRSGACLDGRFSLPIGQRVLGRALGRSSVQINKVIRQLQVDGVLRIGYDWVEVLKPAELEARAGFAHNIAYSSEPRILMPISELEPAAG